MLQYDRTYNGGAEQPTRIKHNRGASTDPGATNDVSEGYQVGSTWDNTTAGTSWRCISATTDNAVWLQVGAGIERLTGYTFPASPYLGQMVYMPDYNNASFFWNGTYWLTIEQHQAHWQAQVVSANARTYFPVLWSFWAGILVELVTIAGRVLTTNDASNKWVQKVIYIEENGTEHDLADTEENTGYGFWAAGEFNDNWSDPVYFGGGFISNDYPAWAIDLQKSGSPGNLDPCFSSVSYRFVGEAP